MRNTEEMNLKVIKIGGSVLDRKNFPKIINYIKNQKKKYKKIVLVLSAMKRYPYPYSTDKLSSLATYLTKDERDRLLSIGETISVLVVASILREVNINCVTISNKKLGLITNENHENAEVTKTNFEYIKEKLKENDILIVPGFQGRTEKGVVTTLGRGGSDTSAVIIANKLKARSLDFVKDTYGIYSKNPKKTINTYRYKKINYNVLKKLVLEGSEVCHIKAVEYALKSKMKIYFTNLENNLYTEVSNEF